MSLERQIGQLNEESSSLRAEVAILSKARDQEATRAAQAQILVAELERKIASSEKQSDLLRADVAQALEARALEAALQCSGSSSCGTHCRQALVDLSAGPVRARHGYCFMEQRELGHDRSAPW